MTDYNKEIESVCKAALDDLNHMIEHGEHLGSAKLAYESLVRAMCRKLCADLVDSMQ